MEPKQFLKVGNKYKGTVTKLLDFGAVVEIEIDGVKQTYLLHISNITDNFVKHVEDYMSVGDEIEVIAVPGSVKDIEISTKESSFEAYAEK